MRKTTKRDNINLLISAFLVIGYIVCAYFFSSFVGTTVDAAVGGIINMAIYLVFGLILFYATRVGDGKQLVRFSIPTFILIDLPAIYIIAAYFAVGLPFHTELAANTTVAMLAAAALGYGIPYTFLSGFELVQEAPAGEAEEEAQPEAGGEAYSTLDIAFESEKEAQSGEALSTEELAEEPAQPQENNENEESADETEESAK